MTALRLFIRTIVISTKNLKFLNFCQQINIFETAVHF